MRSQDYHLPPASRQVGVPSTVDECMGMLDRLKMGRDENNETEEELAHLTSIAKMKISNNEDDDQ